MSILAQAGIIYAISRFWAIFMLRMMNIDHSIFNAARRQTRRHDVAMQRTSLVLDKQGSCPA